MAKLINALKVDNAGSVNEKGYFDSYRENIFTGQMKKEFQDMFDEGSGGELHSKAEAVHSSSMLSYNFFHWIDDKHPFKWNGVEYTQVFFEVKMKTIKDSNAPANMDVVLMDKDKKHLLFIESKFTEYTEIKKFELSKSYKDPNRWFADGNWGEVVDYKPERHKYKEGIKQLITHLFGIHGLISCNESKREITNNYVGKHCKSLKGFDFKPENMKFITLIFEPLKEKFVEEHNAYEDYHELFTDFIGKIGNADGLKVVPEWVSYSALWKEMKDQMPNDLQNYLWKRYMKFAQQYD